jgi:hypothetical protein
MGYVKIRAASSYPDKIGNLLMEREGRKEHNQMFCIAVLGYECT